MLSFGVTIPDTVPQRSEILEGLMNYSVYISYFCACIGGLPINVVLQVPTVFLLQFMLEYNVFIQSDTKKRELLKTLTKIEEIQEKQFIDRNRTITTWLLRDSNPNYQCLKTCTACRFSNTDNLDYCLLKGKL